MKRLKTLLITLVMLTVGTTIGMSQHGNMNGQDMQMGSGSMMGQSGSMMNSPMHQSMMYISALPDLDTLNLSKQQRRELTEMRESFMQSHKGQMQGMMAVKKQMRKAMLSDSAGQKQVKNLMNQTADMMTGMQTSMTETKTNMMDKLDEEQKNILSNMSGEKKMSMLKNNMSMDNMMNMCPMMAKGGMMHNSSGMMNNKSGSGMGSGMNSNDHQEHQ